jgi:hypothetical protein
MDLSRALFAVLLTACATFACAQNGPKPGGAFPAPPNANAAVNSAVESMLPMLEKMTDAMVAAQLKVSVKPETAEAIATFKRNLYEALRRKGFSSAEALQIVLATPLPMAQVNAK